VSDGPGTTPASAGRTLTLEHRLDPARVTEVRALLHAAIEADGVYPLSEHTFLHLVHGGDVDDRNLLLRAPDGSLAGYAHLDVSDQVEGPSGELVVHPAHRGQGHGSALVRALLDAAGGRLRLWSHGDSAAAGALAARLGFVRTRVLFQMRRSLLAPLPSRPLPADVTLRTFEVGRDEERWIAVNNAAFADHPDQGTWTLEDLRLRENEEWFDPAGFFLAERDADLVAFHWTKVHGGRHADHAHDAPPADSDHRHLHEHDAIGEVYVVGVSPGAQGQGLGPAMTVIGLRHLRSRGLAQAMLYVDEENTNAIRVYEGLGFSRWDTDVLYRHTA
jgi:mycothiol synthase